MFGNISSSSFLISSSYLSEEDVLAKENPFVQLVSGVVWLLRDSKIYVNQSQALECSETQKTGERLKPQPSIKGVVAVNKGGGFKRLHFFLWFSASNGFI